MAEDKKLHFKYEDGHWFFLITRQPTKYQDTLEMNGWKPVP